MEVAEGFDQISEIEPYWMAAHARLKNEFAEKEKYHNRMTLLISRKIVVRIQFYVVSPIYKIFRRSYLLWRCV